MAARTRQRRRTDAFSSRILAAILLVANICGSRSALADDEFANGRRIFLEKADCQYCHGWAGDGAGQGQSPGGAANLRQSKLARDQLIMVISCGIPGTAMPHFDDQAYTDKRCYGMTGAELGDRVPNFPPSTTLPKRDVEAVADYLLAKIIGRGPITREECKESFGERAHSCDDYPAK
ncbi:MAG TPA: c-type cytochrome [Xanthobacteraceae bacterium]|jgi:mono/diheme cytochrome c family protein|nr:c-type cytochrome [Xanthobacteraceae bacterium]